MNLNNMMGYERHYTGRAACTNKVCDYVGETTFYNMLQAKEKVVCPLCGFKTLIPDLFGMYNSDKGDILDSIQLYNGRK